MKKPLKIGLIGVGIVLLAIILFSVVYFVKFQSETKKMSPVGTKEITAHIFSIEDSFVNMFLIQDSDRYVAIDAGNSIDNISKGLKELNINPDKVVAVLLTHSDGDHVAALKLFKNAKIYLSKQEEQMLNGQTARMLYVKNKIDTTTYSLIDDQQTFYIGNLKIKGILTPGHTPGSMCYVISESFLFVGDALSLQRGKIARFNDAFNMDSKMAEQSMNNITHLPNVNYLFTAHYGYSSNYHKAVGDWTDTSLR
jgi:hydroxyacylglutathione hydrolase